jgi:23S rRNA (pseudouridine1915-N3)-methyltransferase
MQLLLLAVGKVRPTLREACDDYLRRIQRVVAVTEREVRQAGQGGDSAWQRDDEGRRILDTLPSGMPMVLLDRVGERWTSEQLAERMHGWRLAARDRAIVIGGATGVSTVVRERAETVWSLGPLTLPHELVRVIVAEQLYRATTILQGQPYHKGAGA